MSWSDEFEDQNAGLRTLRDAADHIQSLGHNANAEETEQQHRPRGRFRDSGDRITLGLTWGEAVYRVLT
jgi:hypothetical protein